MQLIKTEEEYIAALERVEELFDATEGTAEADELDVWVLLVGNYESKHYAIDLPDPIAAIKIRMEENNWKQANLIHIIGSKSKVSEVLNKKRKLSLNMIRNLHDALHISLDVLVQKYDLV